MGIFGDILGAATGGLLGGGGGGGGVGTGLGAGSIGSTSKQSLSTDTANTRSQTGYVSGNGLSYQIDSGGAPVTLQDQGSLQAAFAIVSKAFDSIEHGQDAQTQAYNAALGTVSATATPGGTFDTQKVFTYGLGVIALIGVALILTHPSKHA